jgi:hypothetical protein
MTVTVLKERSCLKIAIVPIDELKPHEKGSPLYLELIKREILKEGVLHYPIVVDEKTRVILDGMHRWLALKSLGYTMIPAILVDALQSSKIRVGKRRIERYANGLDSSLTGEEVIRAALTGHLMEPRTTRHFFPFSKFQRVDYSLHMLTKGDPSDVSQYLAKTCREKCYVAFRKWLDEISEELEFLARRKDEVESEQKELLNRIKNIDYAFSAR